MVKLVDLRSETLQDVDFGTCEYCMSTSDLDIEFFVFEDDEGNTYEIETGEMEMDGYSTIYDIGNIADFSHFILEKEIIDMKTLKDEFDNLYFEYIEKLEKERYPEEDHGSFVLGL